jgi:hypothetical protein
VVDRDRFDGFDRSCLLLDHGDAGLAWFSLGHDNVGPAWFPRRFYLFPNLGAT